jgi:hypothetical protein
MHEITAIGRHCQISKRPVENMIKKSLFTRKQFRRFDFLYPEILNAPLQQIFPLLDKKIPRRNTSI